METRKVKVTAIFTGADHSLGYRHGERYELDIWDAPSNLLQYQGNKHTFVSIPDESETECEYESINSLTANWTNISRVK